MSLFLLFSFTLYVSAQIICSTVGDCGFGSYCQSLDGTCSAPGVCVRTSSMCTKEYRPVCGCDNRTYSNACMASARNVSILRRTACSVDPSCTSNSDCTEEQYCKKALDGSQCTVSKNGVCADRPFVCTMEHAPVCGCDGTTYSNGCMAESKGTNFLRTGPCPGSSNNEEGNWLP